MFHKSRKFVFGEFLIVCKPCFCAQNKVCMKRVQSHFMNKTHCAGEEDVLYDFKLSTLNPLTRTLPDRMKNIPDTKARMVRCGRMCPMLLMTKAVKTKSRETMGKGVAVRTISGERGGSWERIREGQT